MILMDGKAVAAEVLAEVKKGVEEFTKKYHPIGLTIIRVGDDMASGVYVRNKVRACAECGIVPKIVHFPNGCSYDAIASYLREDSNNPNTQGVLLQLPLPENINQSALIQRISPDKDVDGFSNAAVAGMCHHGSETLLPACTPAGCMELLRHYHVPLDGANAVVVGRSDIVGKPMALMLLHANCTVTVCHSHTHQQELRTALRNADIVVSAVGKPGFITGDMIKPGAAVLDVGINRISKSELCGDVDFESAKDVAGWLSPVPGGVGPMTVAMLMKNTLQAALGSKDWVAYWEEK